MKTVVYALCLSLFFVQCKKEDLNASPLISKIKIDGKTSQVFLYNTANQLIEYQVLFNDGINVWDSRRYTWQNDLVSKMEYWSAHAPTLSSTPAAGKPMTLQSIEKYQYDKANQLVKSEYFRDEKTALISYATYQYDAIGRRYAKSIFLPNGDRNIVNNYEFNNKGNIVKAESSYWTYDDGKNPFLILNIPEPIDLSWRSQNNPSSNYGIDAQGTTYNTWNFSYTYDAQSGFPTFAKISIDSKIERKMEFIYQ
jgi:hypothetical protein